MPEFTPTMWMLNNHRNRSQEEEDWEIYGECVREAMARYSGLTLDNRTNKEKLDYEDFMHGNKSEVVIDAKIYHYPQSLDDNYVAMSQDDVKDTIQ